MLRNQTLFGKSYSPPDSSPSNKNGPAGTTAAVVGATGSGKSTLLEAVAGVLDRTEGTIAIGGVDIADVAADDWTTAVAIAFQESFLFTDTIVENVALGAVGLEAELTKRVLEETEHLG